MLIGLGDLAEPEIQAILDTGPSIALQALHLRRREGMLLVEAGEDYVEPLLDSMTGARIDLGDALVGTPQPTDEVS